MKNTPDDKPVVNERAQILLKTLVETYIAEGQPVGSTTLLAQSGLEVSPATIRNVMSDLEKSGFIASPHTSAGRVPTQKGYRMFVDSLLTVKDVDQFSIAQLKSGLSSPSQKELINQAADMLSQLTAFAGVVMTPKRERIGLKHLEFLPLSEKRILVIIVSDDGNVQNRIILLDKPVEANQLTHASNYFNEHFAGLTYDEAHTQLHAELKKMQGEINTLMKAALDQNDNAQEENVVIAGERNLLKVDELSTNVGSLRKVFEVFEQRSALVQLLDKSQKAEGIQIFIGEESGYLPLDECSMVTAPYAADGAVVGTLGVIGPTRMAYERVIPIVDITSKLLSNALSNQTK